MAKRQVPAGELLSLYANEVAIAAAGGSVSVSDTTFAVTSTGLPITIDVGSTAFVATASGVVAAPSAAASGAAHFGTGASSTTILTSAIPQSSVLAYGMGGSGPDEEVYTTAISSKFKFIFLLSSLPFMTIHSITILPILSKDPFSPDTQSNITHSRLHGRLPNRAYGSHYNHHDHPLRLHRPWRNHGLCAHSPHDDRH